MGWRLWTEALKEHPASNRGSDIHPDSVPVSKPVEKKDLDLRFVAFIRQPGFDWLGMMNL